MVEVYNNQDAVALSDTILDRLEEVAQLALPLALANPAHGGGVLPELDLVEVSIVDDPTIDQVHRDFMDISGPTDVITFAHGEIVISVETAQRYAKEYSNGFERELMLYIVHGLLHLSGHEDAIDSERQAMEKVQFEILEKVWTGTRTEEKR
ncbi:rRNA maturation RNase YbeY [Rubritalea profundi]|uniref:rRNA maturation RNase YbeY n=1 Tax=Rubritalea profundi TaxID=1658618 RepID=UPI000CF46607|nr:rRNA maturation RNase YbeY [Rubritalea profundi]